MKYTVYSHQERIPVVGEVTQDLDLFRIARWETESLTRNEPDRDEAALRGGTEAFAVETFGSHGDC